MITYIIKPVFSDQIKLDKQLIRSFRDMDIVILLNLVDGSVTETYIDYHAEVLEYLALTGNLDRFDIIAYRYPSTSELMDFIFSGNKPSLSYLISKMEETNSHIILDVEGDLETKLRHLFLNRKVFYTGGNNIEIFN